MFGRLGRETLPLCLASASSTAFLYRFCKMGFWVLVCEKDEPVLLDLIFKLRVAGGLLDAEFYNNRGQEMRQ